MKRNIFNYVLIVIIMVSVALSMCGCGNTAEQNDKYNDKYLELLRAGDQALEDGKFEDALSAYQQAIELSPAVPQAYHRMFDTYVRDERFDDALMFALDNYRNIRPKMTEQSDVAYEEEESLYAGMTPREETALFFVKAMDLGLHKGAAIKNAYPQEEISEFVTYVCDAQDAINDNGLTASCEDIMDTGSKYSDIVTRMREAGVIVSADLDARSQEELLDLGLGDPTVETVESGKIGFADLITPEEAAAFEKELRALLEKDPDLIFLYFDIANLYIQAGDREQAELVYQEGQTALRDMLSRKGYITEATVPLFEAQFANLYYMGVIASAGVDENAVLTKTAEQYKEAIDAVNKAKDDLPLSDDEKQTIQGASDKYCGQLEECIESLTSGDADNSKKIEMHVETYAVESADNSTPVESNEEAQRIRSDSVTLSGKIKRVSNVEPPDQRYELYEDGINIHYIFDSVSYEGDMEKTSQGSYYIFPSWGIELESPITLVLGERKITVTEMGVVSYQELKENQTYTLTGQIYDLYNMFYTQDFADCGYIGWEDVETERTIYNDDENENDNVMPLFDYGTCSYDLNNRVYTEYGSSTNSAGILEFSSIMYFPFGQFAFYCDD